MTIVYVLFAIICLGLIASIIGALIELDHRIQDKRRARAMELDHQEAIVGDLIRNDLIQLEEELLNPEPEVKANYRHNLHCPVCGRFSSSIGADVKSAMGCKLHGIQVRWEEMPIDWAIAPLAVIEGVRIRTQAIPVMQPRQLTTPLTGAIDIIFPHDDELELEVMGAVL